MSGGPGLNPYAGVGGNAGCGGRGLGKQRRQRLQPIEGNQQAYFQHFFGNLGLDESSKVRLVHLSRSEAFAQDGRPDGSRPPDLTSVRCSSSVCHQEGLMWSTYLAGSLTGERSLSCRISWMHGISTM